MVNFIGSIVIVVFAVLLVWGIILYNNLIKARERVGEAWGSVDAHLKERYNLIPNLVDTVKGYAKHESDLFIDVTNAREQARVAGDVKQQSSSEGLLSATMGKLLAISEDYPEIKSDSNFLDLQTQLSRVESEIQNARRYYNGTVRELNICVGSVPSNIVSRLFDFREGEFFELDVPSERDVPKVQF